jgi:hypothetical protein
MRVVVVAAAALGLAACGGVPSNSSPQVVKRVGQQAQPSEVAVTPQPGEGPREVVSDFLSAVATADTNHTAALGFLTADAQQRWSDATVTVLQTDTISNFDNGAIQVTGQKAGSVSINGAYQPALQGGTTDATFGLTQVKGQWRINAPPNGVILSEASFEALYTQHPVYFFDLAEKHLVPDPRFTTLTDPALLATWLVKQLATGEIPALQNAVTNELPTQTDVNRVSVTIGNPTTVTLPGAGQLDSPTRNLLAAQLAITLAQVPTVRSLQVIDTGRPVSIPRTGGTTFSALDFPELANESIPAPTLYYIRNGGVVDENGHPLAGGVGSGTYGLGSAAVASLGSGDLRVAGVSGNGANAKLLIGTLQGGLKTTSVRGQLSRPAWVPGRDEVWVGDGSGLRFCTLSLACRTAPLVPASSSLPGRESTIAAVRFSPEGARIAVVIDAPDGTAQVWIGAVVRTATQVSVDGLTQITPTGVFIRDVAWNDPLKLFVIGWADSSGTSGNVYEVQVDGSLWTPRTIANLPGVPDSITVAENEDAWVSAGSASETVWVQRAGAWASPSNGQTPGVNPVYLE